MKTTAASHTIGKGSQPDNVFSVVQKAREAKANLGEDKVIDGSIGAMRGEDGKFSIIPAFDELYRNSNSQDMYDYSTITGSAAFQKAAIEYAFMGCMPQGVIARAVGTPGGTGAIRMMMYNYLENGDYVLIPDWCWGAYKTIAGECQRQVATYALFNSNLCFDSTSVKEKSAELIEKQNQILAIFNTPGHNPTGYSISSDEWSDLIAFYIDLANKYPEKHIAIGLDMAYVDYSGDPIEARSFLKLFEDLPDNIQPLIGFSMSKSFCAYGLRSGALIGFHKDPEVMESFFQISTYSARGTWSNGAHGAQEALVHLMENTEITEKANRERAELSGLLKARAEIFVNEAKEVGLDILPYRGGFFITIPAKNPKETADKLQKKNIFLVPLAKGVRLAICGVPKNKIGGIATAVKECL